MGEAGRAVIFGYEPETTDVAVFFTLLFLEAVLSFDNAAVLAAMVRKLPVPQRRKALLYGLGGAYVFRILAILGASFIISNPWLKAVGGGYLVFLMLKHLLSRDPHGEDANLGPLKFLKMNSFWGIVIAVELADIAFALDQVLVAVAMTDKIPVIILASMVGILFLRLAASYMARMMDWFPQLETLAYLAVGFVGVKLIAIEVLHYFHFPTIERILESEVLAITVTMSLLVVPVLVKYILERLRGKGTNGEPPAA